jgi:uncharacterized protein YndB with AHSA1/START domain
VTPADAYLSWYFDITAPRQTVWEYFTVPGQRQKWWPAEAIIEQSNKGRRGIGTENHCMHGKNAIIEEVLDWRPSDYLTVNTLLPVSGAPKIMLTHAFEEGTDGITRIEMRVGRPKPKDRAFVDQAAGKFRENITRAVETLRAMLEELQRSPSMIDESALRPRAD